LIRPDTAVGWFPVLLLGLGAFLAGGAYSFYSQGRRPAMIILAVLAVMAIVAAALYAWDIV
jgi:hypothetical protein